MMPLGLLGEGERGEIVSVRVEPDAGCGCRKTSCCGAGRRAGCRVEDLGLRAGKTVEMLANGRGGPLLLRIDEARIAVDRGVAMKIMVRR